LKVLVRRVALVVVIGNGIADEQKLRVRVASRRFEHGFMTFSPPGLAQTICWNNGRILGSELLWISGKWK
jgi:hypothetical protein